MSKKADDSGPSTTTLPSRTGRLAFLLGRLERLNESLMTEVAAEHDLSVSDIRVLAVLRHGSPQTRPGDISRWIVQTPGGLTATLRRLESDGLIERRAYPDDARGRLVALTGPGAERYDRVLAAITSRYREIFADVDYDAAFAVVRELVEALERTGDHAPAARWAADLMEAPT